MNTPWCHASSFTAKSPLKCLPKLLLRACLPRPSQLRGQLELRLCNRRRCSAQLHMHMHMHMCMWLCISACRMCMCPTHPRPEISTTHSSRFKLILDSRSIHTDTRDTTVTHTRRQTTFSKSTACHAVPLGSMFHQPVRPPQAQQIGHPHGALLYRACHESALECLPPRTHPGPRAPDGQSRRGPP